MTAQSLRRGCISCQPFAGLSCGVIGRARCTAASTRVAKLLGGILPPFFLAVAETTRLAAVRVMGEDLLLDISDSLMGHRNMAAPEVSCRGVDTSVEFSGKLVPPPVSIVTPDGSPPWPQRMSDPWRSRGRLRQRTVCGDEALASGRFGADRKD